MADDEEKPNRVPLSLLLALPLIAVQRGVQSLNQIEYVGYVVWDTIEDRKNPAASVELKQSHFMFPDVVVCTSFLKGCLSESANCLEDQDLTLLGQTGFMEDTDEFDLADYPDVAKVRAEFPTCAVMPLSQLTVNETGVNNGDITYFAVSFYMLWHDDPYDEFNATEFSISSQYVSVHFTDIEQDVEKIGEKITDVKLPYERMYATQGEWIFPANNHMVINLAEFSGITKNGVRKEREQTYSQTTTTSQTNWFWTSEVELTGLAFLQVDMLITKFEYTSVVEVDPVDIWAIIGAIGGVWQFVIVAFGVFFIFSEKQPPDKKMRNFYKTAITPAVKINRRLSSSTSATSSQQDIEIDAADEDLPPGWLKKQGRNGSVYYFHRMTGATSVTPPNERDRPSETVGVTVAPRSQKTIRRLFRGAHKSQGSATDGLQDSTNGTNDGGSLPPGWLERADGDGRVYFMDTVNHTTQWDRPVWRVRSASGGGVRAVDTPMRHTRRVSNPPSYQAPAPSSRRPDQLPPAATGDVVEEPLPPNWETRITPDERTYYFNAVSQTTQWTRPACRVRSTSGSGVQAADTAMRRTRQSSKTASPQVPIPSTALPSTNRGGTRDVVDDSLPPDWETRTTPGGKKYYCDTVNQTTHWDRPVRRVDPASGSSVQATHTTIRRPRRPPNAASSQVSPRATAVPSNATAATGGVVNQPLPPNWKTHITKDGKKCYANSVTKETQWDTPL